MGFHRELAAATDNLVLGFLLDPVRGLLSMSPRITNWARGEERAELTAAIGRGKDRQGEAVNG